MNQTNIERPCRQPIKIVSMKFLWAPAFLLLSAFLFSCRTQQKLPYYIENVVDTSGKNAVKFPELKIQKNDRLAIHVYSLSTRPEQSDQMYNLTGGESQQGYLVDAFGNIEYPRLGTFHVEGLTKKELVAQIKERLTKPVELLKEPNVIIRFLNYRILVMGEVGRTGEISATGERVTILEAIALAGGITDFGKKNDVKVIRESDGIREIGIIDLTTEKVFESPYYNLLQNDIIMVQPSDQKAKQLDQTIVTQRISLALSLITAAAFIYNIFK